MVGWGQGILWKGWWILECSLLLDPSHLRLHSKGFLSLILFAFSKSTKTVYPKCCRIGRWEFLISTAFNDLIQTTLKQHKYIYTHNQFWCIQGNVFIYPGKCVYLPLWASFVIEASGSQPAEEMWDLYLLFLTSVTDDFLPRPFTSTHNRLVNEQWLGAEFPLLLGCEALLLSTGCLAHRKHRVCPHQELESLEAFTLGQASITDWASIFPSQT